MRWNLKKPRTGLNLSYHFHWSSQMLAILLWIAKPVWQRCLPFSKLPFFSKKSAKKPLFLCTFSTTKKNSSNRKKGCSWPLKKGRLIFKVHTQDFLVVCLSIKNNSSWIILEVKYLAIYIVILLCWKKKRGLPQSSSFKKSIYFLELLCLVCICSLGAKIRFQKKK